MDKVELAAMVAHEVNRAYCESVGDKSQVPWDDAEQWQRESVLAGVDSVKCNPSITPEDLHYLWIDHKIKDGWVYGEVKDADKKTHPCMKPYDELPPPQRTKDALFGAAVKAVLFSDEHKGDRPMEQIVPTIIDAALPVLCAALTWAAAKGAAWLSAKTKSEYLASTAHRLYDAIETAVNEVEMTIKAEIKAARADGVITQAEYMQIKASAVALAKTYLGPKGIKAIIEVLGIDSALIDKFIGGKIEQSVKAMKDAAATVNPK